MIGSLAVMVATAMLQAPSCEALQSRISSARSNVGGNRAWRHEQEAYG